MIQYPFLNGTKMLKLSESWPQYTPVKVYPSVRLCLQRQLENKEQPKKAVFQLEKEKGGVRRM